MADDEESHNNRFDHFIRCHFGFALFSLHTAIPLRAKLFKIITFTSFNLSTCVRTECCWAYYSFDLMRCVCSTQYMQKLFMCRRFRFFFFFRIKNSVVSMNFFRWFVPDWLNYTCCALLENSFHSKCNQFELGTLAAQKKNRTWNVKCWDSRMRDTENTQFELLLQCLNIFVSELNQCAKRFYIIYFFY